MIKVGDGLVPEQPHGHLLAALVPQPLKRRESRLQKVRFMQRVHGHVINGRAGLVLPRQVLPQEPRLHKGLQKPVRPGRLKPEHLGNR